MRGAKIYNIQAVYMEGFAMYVLGIGAANVDVHGMSRAAIVMRDSNPGHLRTSAGGVTRNVMENLARMGVGARMVSALGCDLFGELVRRESEAAGLDMSGCLMLPGVTSSAYVSILDERADMLVAMSDMSVLEHVTPEVIDSKRPLILGAAAVVCDPCLPAAALERILDAAGDVPVFLDPVSTAYAHRAAPFAGRFYGLKPNSLELGILAGMDTDSDLGVERAAAALIDRGAKCVAVSLGERGCYYADAAGNRFYRALRPVSEMRNATGAGDAFLAGLVFGFVRGYGPEQAVDCALAAGHIAVESDDTISREMSELLLKYTIKNYSNNP